jgi:hypothetical protein
MPSWSPLLPGGISRFRGGGERVDPQPHDVVTPSQAAEIFGVPASTVRTWIARRGVKPLGKIGRYNRYDFRELAEIERDMRAA